MGQNHSSQRVLAILTSLPIQLAVTLAGVFFSLLAAYVSYRLTPLADRLTTIEASANENASRIQSIEQNYLPLLLTTSQQIKDIADTQKQDHEMILGLYKRY